MFGKIKILVVMTACLLSVACSPITRSSGVVTDEKNTPLEAVKLKIDGKSVFAQSRKEIYSSAQGKYDFGELQVSSELPIEITLTAFKEGYEPAIREIKFNEKNEDKIVLKKLK
jgi:hypothetical protein